MQDKIDIRYSNGEVYIRNYKQATIMALHVFYNFQGGEGDIDITLPNENWIYQANSSQIVCINLAPIPLPDEFVIFKYVGDLKINSVRVVDNKNNYSRLLFSSVATSEDRQHGNVRAENDSIQDLRSETFAMETRFKDLTNKSNVAGKKLNGRKSNTRLWVNRYNKANNLEYVKGSENSATQKGVMEIMKKIKSARGGY